MATHQKMNHSLTHPSACPKATYISPSLSRNKTNVPASQCLSTTYAKMNKSNNNKNKAKNENFLAVLFHASSPPPPHLNSTQPNPATTQTIKISTQVNTFATPKRVGHHLTTPPPPTRTFQLSPLAFLTSQLKHPIHHNVGAGSGVLGN